MFDSTAAGSHSSVRGKSIAFAAVAVMAAYVLYHNERFLLNAAHPVWEHYAPFKWWLLPHALAGLCALVLAPMQFSERLRRRYTKLHRITGRIYVASAFLLAPLGAYIGYLDEAQGAPRAFTVMNATDAALLMATTGIGFVFALKRNIVQHRQWMTRSYAVALVFFEARVILGVTGWDKPPPDFATITSVVWVCLAFSLLIGDAANQLYDVRARRVQPSRREPSPLATAGLGEIKAAE
jgi:uncharacterized membrane protein